MQDKYNPESSAWKIRKIFSRDFILKSIFATCMPVVRNLLYFHVFGYFIYMFLGSDRVEEVARTGFWRWNSLSCLLLTHDTPRGRPSCPRDENLSLQHSNSWCTFSFLTSPWSIYCKNTSPCIFFHHSKITAMTQFRLKLELCKTASLREKLTIIVTLMVWEFQGYFTRLWWYENFLGILRCVQRLVDLICSVISLALFMNASDVY